MIHVNPIYVFTLGSYVELFLTSIKKSAKDSDVSRRIQKLNAFHQFAVFQFACRTVFQKHSLTLAFHMYTQMLIRDDKLDKDEYEFFILESQNTEHVTELNICSDWLPQDCWNRIVLLELLPKFFGITVTFYQSPKLWYDWYSSPDPENKLLPGNLRNTCTEFEKLLVIRCLRPDRIKECVNNLIASNLGQNFVIYPTLDMKEVFVGSSANKPLLLFTLSSNIDPEMIISKLANESGIEYRTLSLGEGKEHKASQLIVEGIKKGDWIFISNCHLLQSWLPTLEKIVNKLQTVRAHKRFRLWLGSFPIKTFPASVLQNSIIITLDSPKGIQANMKFLFKKFVSETQMEFEKIEPKFKCLLYALSFFHSVLLGRKSFRYLGWNSEYNFSYSDFKVSSQMLQFYLDKYEVFPLEALRKMIAEISYGGHMSNIRDDELLIQLQDQFICDEASSNPNFSLSTVGRYLIPSDGELKTYLDAINSLPNFDVPEVFGQDPNAELPSQRYDADQLLISMSKIIQKEAPVESQESQVIAIISNIRNVIPDIIDKDEALKILHNRPEPYHYVLVQESSQYNILLETVFKDAQNLEDAIAGKQIMTEKMHELANIIQQYKVPYEWQKIYPSLKPLGSWLNDLKKRVKFFSNWISTGSLPIKVWLPAFSNPSSFLNATLLNAAKTFEVTLQELKWEYHVSSFEERHIVEAAPEGVYVRGLFLEGAGWDKTNSMLIAQEPLCTLTPMPVILFKPVTESSVRGVYNCPCYYTSTRSDKEGKSLELFSIDLKTRKEKEHWEKCNTCILLSSDT